MPRRNQARRLQQGFSGRELAVLVSIAVSVCFLACLKGYASQSQSGASAAGPATIPKNENSNGRAEAARLYAEAERLYRLGAYEKAQQAAENALQLRGQSPGHENPETAACLVLLGRIADGKDDFARGAGLYKQALAIDEKALGKTALKKRTHWTARPEISLQPPNLLKPKRQASTPCISAKKNFNPMTY